MHKTGQSYEISGHTLTCFICHHTHFTKHQALLSSKGASFLGMDWNSPNADTYVCTNCNAIQWFLSSEVNKIGRPYEIAGRILQCPLCGVLSFTYRQTLLSSKSTAFFKVDWLNPNADTYFCTGCGYIFWFFPLGAHEQGQSCLVAGQTLNCTFCDHANFREREALLSTKRAALLEIDWLNPNAQNTICTYCGFIHWFSHG